MSFQRTRTRSLTVSGIAAVGALTLFGAAAPASAETEVDEPDYFTSAYTVMATPDQVLNPDGEPTPGPDGATGTFTFRVNSDLEIICYDITVEGISGDYESPAKTATHIHQAAEGEAGPPRIAFPNPEPIGDGPRTSEGCLEGPFTTGIEVDGADTGEGFTLSALEDDFANFASDTHTVANPAGAVRGQLTEIPVGGVDTGAGGTAGGQVDPTAVIGIAAGAAALLALGGVVVHRRRSATSAR